ncbi:MAG: hypothetical protein Q8P57_03715 [Candidatus Pacearchaeota archaeon]|nr:hypothetical protein [Candidatus Pacearchaeota archaeon]
MRGGLYAGILGVFAFAGLSFFGPSGERGVPKIRGADYAPEARVSASNNPGKIDEANEARVSASNNPVKIDEANYIRITDTDERRKLLDKLGIEYALENFKQRDIPWEVEIDTPENREKIDEANRIIRQVYTIMARENRWSEDDEKRSLLDKLGFEKCIFDEDEVLSLAPAKGNPDIINVWLSSGGVSRNLGIEEGQKSNVYGLAGSVTLEQLKNYIKSNK